MRILFLPASLARLAPGHPAVFMVSDLAREILLTLTGPRNELGMTFYEWRTQLRIYHALVLLADGHDTTHVAHACGWANPSSFIAAFANIIGTTPGRYRTSHQRRTTP